jgi:nucleotide-binding universal stress UspA family protein
MFKTTVVASDGSTHARRAVQIASDLAAKYQAKLMLLHVLGDGPLPEAIARMADTEYMTEAPPPNPTNVANVQGSLAVSERGVDTPEHRERVRQVVAEKILGEAERTARSAGVTDIACSSEQGDAADRILEFAKRESADLIVMGCRGLSDLKGLLMGSVSHKVCQRSDCSCITVK